MAGIKHIYREIDSFRLPTYDPAISYYANSIVVYLDSDKATGVSRYNLYLAKVSTTQGSMDSDIKRDEWQQISFDSDTIFKQVRNVIDNNHSSIVHDIESDLEIRFRRHDSDVDSDFGVFYRTVDSDFKSIRFYVDSELAKHKSIITQQLDSDVRSLNNIINNYVEVVSIGRLYDSETVLAETVATRLSNIKPDTGGASTKITANFADQVQEDTTITWKATTSSSQDYQSGLQRSVAGAHRIAANQREETITSYFTVPAYVGSFSFRGLAGLGSPYFQSGIITWTYEGGTTSTETQTLVANSSDVRITFYNPQVQKRVTNIDIIGTMASAPSAGINYIQISSAYAPPELRAARANILHFQTVNDLLRYQPHDDTLGLVYATNSMYHSKDSEWVSTGERYFFVDTTEANLNTNKPATNLTGGLRALTTTDGFEYYVENGEWVLDFKSVDGFDSELVANLDSDVRSVVATIPTITQSIQVVENRSVKSDSEIIVIQKALQTFYVDYIKLKQEHKRVHRDVDSEVLLWSTRFNTLLKEYDSEKRLADNHDSDWRVAAFTSFQTILNTQLTGNTNVVGDIKSDLDSDTLWLQNAILSNSVDISLLRNGEVADNDSDIRSLERHQVRQDSDIIYNRSVAMKFRGTINVSDSEQYPKMVEPYDVYVTRTKSTASDPWGLLSGSVVQAGTLLMYTTDYGWTVLSATGGDNAQIRNIGVPAGTILQFPTHQAIPDSFHLCDGSLFDAGLYSELYDVLGTNTLPDLRGVFLRGWSDDVSQDPDAPREPLSTQVEMIGPHTHQYTDFYPNSPDPVLNGLGDEAVDGTLSRTVATNTNTGIENRPANTAIVYAIAMFTGAGSTAQNYDSDLRSRQREMDSDLIVVTFNHSITANSLQEEIHNSSARDSDLSVRIDRVLYFAQNSRILQVSAYSGSKLTALGEYDITSQVINTLTPELFCFPDIKFFYATEGGTNIHTTHAGRQLNGTFGMPNVGYKVLHDVVGNTSIQMYSDTEITNDIQIVSTFRTR